MSQCSLTLLSKGQNINNARLVEVSIRKVEKNFNRGYRNDVLRRFGNLENYRKMESRRNYVPTEIEVRAWAEHFFLGIPVVSRRGRYMVGCKCASATDEIVLDERKLQSKEIEERKKGTYRTTEEEENKIPAVPGMKVVEETTCNRRVGNEETTYEAEEEDTRKPETQVARRKDEHIVLSAESQAEAYWPGRGSDVPKRKIDLEALMRKEFEIETTDTVSVCYQNADPDVERLMNEDNGYESYFMEMGEGERMAMELQGEEKKVTVDSAASKSLVAIVLVRKEDVLPCAYQIIAADDQELNLLGKITLKLSAQ
ncbi:putative MFS-type transporter, partial [Frankliniella fusca]